MSHVAHDSPPWLNLLMDDIRARCRLAVPVSAQERVCVKCNRPAILKHGQRTGKWAVNGTHGCICWSGSIAKLDGWFATIDEAWKWFEDGQQRYKHETELAEF